MHSVCNPETTVRGKRVRDWETHGERLRDTRWETERYTVRDWETHGETIGVVTTSLAGTCSAMLNTTMMTYDNVILIFLLSLTFPIGWLKRLLIFLTFRNIPHHQDSLHELKMMCLYATISVVSTSCNKCIQFKPLPMPPPSISTFKPSRTCT